MRNGMEACDNDEAASASIPGRALCCTNAHGLHHVLPRLCSAIVLSPSVIVMITSPLWDHRIEDELALGVWNLSLQPAQLQICKFWLQPATASDDGQIRAGLMDGTCTRLGQ